MDKRELEERLRAVREPEPPGDLAVRLERRIPDSFRRPESEWSTGRVWTMAKLGALAAAAAAVVTWVAIGLFTIGPASVDVAVAAVLTPVVEATGQARAVHMILHVRTEEGEDFGFVNLDGDMRLVEVWLQEPLGAGDRGRARVQKSDRIWWFDGNESVLFFSRDNEALRGAGLEVSLFWPAGWLQRILEAPPEDVEVLEHEEAGGEGRLLLRESGASVEPLEPAFFSEFDRETEILWDLDTRRLKKLRRWVDHDGERRLFVELASIEYLPSIHDGVFRIDLPADVRWAGLSDVPVRGDEIALGPREVAERIFEASKTRDRDTLEYFIDSPGTVDWFMTHDVELVSLGEPFRVPNRAAHFVPYEAKVRWGGIFHYTKKHNLALRNDNPDERWHLDGGW